MTTRAFGMLLLWLLAVGCKEPNIGLVSGTVTVDGTAADNGSITFYPADGQSFTAGAVITNGNYTTQVPLGKSRVVIRVPKVVGETKLYETVDSPMRQLLDEALPARYNDESELEITVVRGPQEHNFETTTE